MPSCSFSTAILHGDQHKSGIAARVGSPAKQATAGQQLPFDAPAAGSAGADRQQVHLQRQHAPLRQRSKPSPQRSLVLIVGCVELVASHVVHALMLVLAAALCYDRRGAGQQVRLWQEAWNVVRQSRACWHSNASCRQGRTHARAGQQLRPAPTG